jgi:hypothetical protein
MDFYQKVRLGMLIAAFAIPVIVGAFGLVVKPLDEIGGGFPI